MTQEILAIVIVVTSTLLWALASLFLCLWMVSQMVRRLFSESGDEPLSDPPAVAYPHALPRWHWLALIAVCTMTTSGISVELLRQVIPTDVVRPVAMMLVTFFVYGSLFCWKLAPMKLVVAMATSLLWTVLFASGGFAATLVLMAVSGT